MFPNDNEKEQQKTESANKKFIRNISRHIFKDKTGNVIFDRTQKITFK